MYLPVNFGTAFILAICSALFWGSWANCLKFTRNCPFALFYWDYILGVIVATLAFAFTLGSYGTSGEPFLVNLTHATASNVICALVAGAIFNVSNVLLVNAIDIAGIAVAFPLAMGIAIVEGVLVSYVVQPKGSIWLIALGVLLAVFAVLFIARAYGALASARNRGPAAEPRNSGFGVKLSIVTGIFVGAFPPFITRAMNAGHMLTPYAASVLLAFGAFACCWVFNIYLMRRPLRGAPVAI
jgi:glucose uptake protein